MDSYRFFTSLFLSAIITSSLIGSVATADENPQVLANQAFGILKAKCYSCHGGEETYSGLRILDRDVLFANRTGKPFIKSGDPIASKIWEVIKEDNMPVSPDDYVTPVPLTAEEKETLRNWILAGAPIPESGADRDHISRLQVLQWIEEDTDDLDSRDKGTTKYLSLVHLHNNPEISEYDLRLHRAALSKALNSISLSDVIVLPKAIDKYNTVYRIDLDDYRWTAQIWSKMLDHYPYGLMPNTRNKAEYELFEDIERNLDGYFDYFTDIRADWFVAKAIRPPLYHMFLNIPEDVYDLEARLGVNRMQDLKRGEMLRAGVLVSGISSQNRIMDRHRSNYGSYWISYDFQKESGNGNIARYPLGPDHGDEIINKFCFSHDGGEIIYRLPNGLQAYMLIDNHGKRIDVGPTSIVADGARVSGTTEIVNGLSCITCHKHGTKSFDDVISFSHAVRHAKARELIDEIYDVDAMQKVLKRDRRDHLLLLVETIGPFLQVGEDKDKAIESFPEPISLVARQYDKNMTVEDIACELGYENSSQINLNDDDLIDLGLGLLRPEFADRPADLVYKRSMWDSIVGGTSVYQEACEVLGLGQPILRKGTQKY